MTVHDVELVQAVRDGAELRDVGDERIGRDGSSSRSPRGRTATSRAGVSESPDAKSVTSCPRRTSSSVSQTTTRSVPP